MKEPEKIPLDPSTHKVKSVNKIPLPKLYPETMLEDIYISNNDIYIYTDNENSQESNKTKS